MAKQKDKIVFSIGVITYDSASTVIETLDSIAAQSYSDLELVISDDGSRDNTVALCKDWLNAHNGRFIRTLIITTDHNTGTSANCNRLFRALNGDYYTIIAGDDKMLPKGIEAVQQYIAAHPDTSILFTHHQCFGGSPSEYRHVDKAFNYDFFNWTPEQRLHQLVFERNCIPAVGVFLNRKTIQNVSVEYDERIPLMEDHPMWINLLRKGLRFP